MLAALSSLSSLFVTSCSLHDAAAESPKKPISSARKAAAVTSAIFPGVLVHGAGHFVAGDRSTAYRLLAIEGAGAGLALGSLGGIAVAGASRRLIAPLVTGLVAGGALLVLPLFADLYGLLAPPGGTGAPLTWLPTVETQLGAAYVYDRIFAYRGFLVPGVDLRHGSLRFSALGFFALNDTNSRTRLEFAYRFFGPKPKGNDAAKDGSYLDAEFAFTHHRFTSNGFSLTTGEINVHGRLDLVRVAPSLVGSFAELGLGMGYLGHNYEGVGVEGDELLTPRFAFGMYLGREGYPRGEVLAYYDHRHDGFSAGLEIPGLASGMAGHFGANGNIYFSPQWGVSFDGSAGSAYFGRLSLLFRHGVAP